jgi:hypothetical protein
LKFVLPKIVRCYYDIETAVFGKSEVPQHNDRNAFITVIGMVFVLPDGTTTKHAFLNNTLRYELETVDQDIVITRFSSETEMC